MKNEKAQHTPGPWRQMAWGQTISIDSVAANYIGVAHINPRGDHNKGIPDSVDRANAALIAAAPELLEALTRGLKYIEMTNGITGSISIMARAALAKAKSE